MQIITLIMFMLLSHNALFSMQKKNPTPKNKKVTFGKDVIFRNNPDEWILITFKFNKNLKNPEIIKLWTDGNYSRLHRAVFHGKLNFLEEFLVRTKNPNIQNINGNTPAHLVIFTQADEILIKEVLKTLKNNNADFNIRNRCGYTPLHLAALNEKPLVYSLLIHFGANQDIKDHNNETPKMLVQKIIKLLPSSRNKIKMAFNEIFHLNKLT